MQGEGRFWEVFEVKGDFQMSDNEKNVERPGERGRRKKRRGRRNTMDGYVSTLGKPPGTLSVSPDARETEVMLLAYRKGEMTETTWKGAKKAKKLKEEYPVLWINVAGLGDLKRIQEVGEAFGVHSLALEDVVNTHQRPKLDEYGDDVFWVARLPGLQEGRFQSQQVSLYLAEGVVITFVEEPNEVFELIRDRIRNGKGRVRGEGADYLAYAVMDAVVDHFFPMLEILGEEIEGLEERVVENPGMEIIREIHNLKRKTTAFRRAVWPLRGVFNKLLTGEGVHFQESTRIYLRDVSDHVFGVLDMLESQRELSSGLLEVYLSSNGNRMNEIMKVLTMIATVFIPLSFIAGLYGMNFKTEISPLNMPELGWYWGYPFVLVVMMAVAGGLMWFFKKKGWWGRARLSRARPAQVEGSES